MQQNNLASKQQDLRNIGSLTNILNKGVLTNREKALIIEIHEAIKDSNDQQIGRDLIDLLKIMKLQ